MKNKAFYIPIMAVLLVTLLSSTTATASAKVYEGSLQDMIVEKNNIELPGDANNDYSVDMNDLDEIVNYYKSSNIPEEKSSVDTNSDGKIDIYDLSKSGINYGDKIFSTSGAKGDCSTIYIYPDYKRVEPDDEFEIYVNITTTDSIFAVSTTVFYDPTIINATSVSEGDFLGSDGESTFPITSIDWNNGIVYYDSTRFDTQTGVSGSGSLVVVTFKALQEGTSDVGIADYELIDENLTSLTGITIENGTVEVNINDPAEINPISDQNVDEGQVLSFNVNATDPEGDNYNLTVIAGPGSMTGNIYSYTPGWDTNHDNEVDTVTIESEDEYGAKDTESFQLTVNDINRDPSINPISDKNVDEGQLLSFSVSGSDPDTDTLSYTVKSGPGSIIGTTYTYSPGWDTNHDNEVYTVTVEATDGHSGSDTEDFQLTVNDINRDPTVNSISNKNVNEGQTLTFSVSGSDPESDTLTYSVKSGLGLIIGTTYSYSPGWDTNHDDEVSSVTIEATDGHSGSDTEDFQLTVNDINRAPSIDSYNPTDTTPDVDEGSSLAFDVTASDPESDTITYSWEIDSLEVSTTDIYTYNPGYADSGPHTVEITISDGSLTDYQSWDVTVNDVTIACTQNSDCGTDGYITDPFCSGLDVMKTYRTYTCSNPGIPSASCSSEDNDITQETCSYLCEIGSCVANDDPVITAIPNQNVNEGQTLSFTVTASDTHGDTVTLSVKTGPGSIVGTTYSYSPGWDTNHDNEVENVVIEATDGHGGSDTETFDFTVNDVNRAPSIDAYWPTDTTPEVDEGNSIGFNVTASDPESDTLSYSWKLDDLEVSTTSTYVYSTDYADSGEHEVVVTVSDGSLTNDWGWTVTVNDVPILCTQNSDCGTDGYITDPFCSGLDVMKTYRTYTCSNPGIPSASCSSEDNDITQETCSYLCEIGSCVANDDPVITAIPNQNVNEGQTLSFTVTASDTHGDTVTLSVKTGPGSLSGTTYSYSPGWDTDHDDEVHSVTIEASDGHGGKDTEPFDITVTDINRAPEIDSYLPSSLTPDVDEGSIMVFNVVSASDPDGDSLSYSWKIDGTDVSTSSSYIHSTDYTDSGTYSVQVTVSDGHGGSDTQSWTLTVNDIDTISIPLSTGQNDDVSIPARPVDTSITSVLASIAGKYNSVMVYDPSIYCDESVWCEGLTTEECESVCEGKRWLSYDPARPPFLNTLDELDDTLPFNIYMWEAATLVVDII